MLGKVRNPSLPLGPEHNFFISHLCVGVHVLVGFSEQVPDGVKSRPGVNVVTESLMHTHPVLVGYIQNRLLTMPHHNTYVKLTVSKYQILYHHFP